MFCIRCGNKLGEEAAFCSMCGYPVARAAQGGDAEGDGGSWRAAQDGDAEGDGGSWRAAQDRDAKGGCGRTAQDRDAEEGGLQAADETEPSKSVEQGELEEKNAKPDQSNNQIKQSEETQGEPGSPKKKTTISSRIGEACVHMAVLGISAVSVCMVLSAMGVDVIRYIPCLKEQIKPATPEFADNIIVFSEEVRSEANYADPNADIHTVLVTDSNELIYDVSNVSAAENGRIAYQTTENEDVHIRDADSSNEDIISAPVDYFKLSGSGENILYCQDDDAYIQNDNGNTEQWIPDAGYVYDISYDGNTISTEYGYSRDGDETDIASGRSVLGMSSDGKYIYYVEEGEFTVDIDGTEHSILGNRSQEDDVYPYIVAYSDDYKEVLFNYGYDIYYFSAKRLEAQYVDTIEDGAVYPIGTFGVSREQPCIIGNVYCMDNYEDGFHNSIVKLNKDLTFTTLVSGIPYDYDISWSRDKKKLWCVSEGALTYCDTARSSDYGNVIYSDIFVSEGADDGTKDVLAVSPNGKKAYVIDTEGTLWKVTPETMYDPVKICDDALCVYYGSDKQFYVIKKGDIFTEYQRGLWKISLNDNLKELYIGGVEKMIHTKKNQYLLQQAGDGDYILQYKDGKEWSYLCRVSERDIMTIHWGSTNDFMY